MVHGLIQMFKCSCIVMICLIFCGVNLVYLYLFNTCFPLIFLRDKIVGVILCILFKNTNWCYIFLWGNFVKISLLFTHCPAWGVFGIFMPKSRDIYFFQLVRYTIQVFLFCFLESPYRIIYCNMDIRCCPFLEFINRYVVKLGISSSISFNNCSSFAFNGLPRYFW